MSSSLIYIPGQPRRDEVVISGRKVKSDLDEELYIRDLYDDYYLKAAEQGKILLTMTFEQFLDKCRATLKWRLGDLDREYIGDMIDKQTRDDGKALAEWGIRAITIYLEKPDCERLIGV